MCGLPKIRTLVITSKYRNGYLEGEGKTRTIREKSEKWSLFESERELSINLKKVSSLQFKLLY